MTSPIIFVPGTSGTFLQAPETFTYNFPGDTHVFTDGTLTHEARPFQYLSDSDVWIGPATVADLLSDTFTVTDTLTLNVNRGNHALDVLRFNLSGLPDQSITSPPIGAGAIIDEVDTGIFKNFLGGWLDIKDPIYKTLLEFLRGKYGPSNVYVYPYDWRIDLRSQIAGLSNLISQITGGVGQVILIAHSLGGLVCRAYYLASQENANKVEKVITMGTGFAGIPLAIKALLAGDTWGLGFNLGSLLPNLAPSWLSVGLAEWEIQSLAQNWPTSYYQGPNSDDWFFDDADLTGRGQAHRSYIRDFRVNPAIQPTTFNTSMAWLIQEGATQAALGLEGLNEPLIEGTQKYYNSLFTSFGNFLVASLVPHYRIMSRAIDTVVATKISYTPSYLGSFGSNSPNPVNANEYQAFTTHEPILGDGDGTVPYHGALGLTDPSDDSVYVAHNIAHLALPEDANVQLLLGCLIDNDFSNFPNVRDTFRLPENAPETI